MQKSIFKEVADNLGIEEQTAKDVFNLTFEFIKDKISSLELKNTNLSEEEFNKIKTSFVLPGLGKIGCGYNNYLRKIKSFRGEDYDKDDECETIGE